jgi:hypothetical protein
MAELDRDRGDAIAADGRSGFEMKKVPLALGVRPVTAIRLWWLTTELVFLKELSGQTPGGLVTMKAQHLRCRTFTFFAWSPDGIRTGLSCAQVGSVLLHRY